MRRQFFELTKTTVQENAFAECSFCIINQLKSVLLFLVACITAPWQFGISEMRRAEDGWGK